MNEFFIYVEDITANPRYLRGGRIFKMTAVTLGLIFFGNDSLLCFTAELDE